MLLGHTRVTRFTLDIHAAILSPDWDVEGFWRTLNHTASSIHVVLFALNASEDRFARTLATGKSRLRYWSSCTIPQRRQETKVGADRVLHFSDTRRHRGLVMRMMRLCDTKSTVKWFRCARTAGS